MSEGDDAALFARWPHCTGGLSSAPMPQLLQRLFPLLGTGLCAFMGKECHKQLLLQGPRPSHNCLTGAPAEVGIKFFPQAQSDRMRRNVFELC